MDIIHNNFAPTHYDVSQNSLSLIDFFVVNNKDSVSFSDQFWIPGISKHAFVYLAYKVSIIKVDQVFQYRDYKRINLSQLLEDVAGQNFGNIFHTNDVNVQLDILNSVIISVFQKTPYHRDEP